MESCSHPLSGTIFKIWLLVDERSFRTSVLVMEAMKMGNGKSSLFTGCGRTKQVLVKEG